MMRLISNKEYNIIIILHKYIYNGHFYWDERNDKMVKIIKTSYLEREKLTYMC